jgi:hypothetical protein
MLVQQQCPSCLSSPQYRHNGIQCWGRNPKKPSRMRDGAHGLEYVNATQPAILGHDIHAGPWLQQRLVNEVSLSSGISTNKRLLYITHEKRKIRIVNSSPATRAKVRASTLSQLRILEERRACYSCSRAIRSACVGSA